VAFDIPIQLLSCSLNLVFFVFAGVSYYIGHGRCLACSGQDYRESDNRDIEILSLLSARNHPQLLQQSSVHRHAHRGRDVYEGFLISASYSNRSIKPLLAVVLG